MLGTSGGQIRAFAVAVDEGWFDAGGRSVVVPAEMLALDHGRRYMTTVMSPERRRRAADQASRGLTPPLRTELTPPGPGAVGGLGAVGVLADGQRRGSWPPAIAAGVAVMRRIFEILHAFRAGELHLVADSGAQQGARDGRQDTDRALAQIGLVGADDADRALGVVIVQIRHLGPEEHARSVVGLRRVDHDGVLEPLGQEADPAIDLAQPLLAVDVVAVLRPVAVAGGPGHGLDQLRPLDPPQAVELRPEAVAALGGSDSGEDRPWRYRRSGS